MQPTIQYNTTPNDHDHHLYYIPDRNDRTSSHKPHRSHSPPLLANDPLITPCPPPPTLYLQSVEVWRVPLSCGFVDCLVSSSCVGYPEARHRPLWDVARQGARCKVFVQPIFSLFSVYFPDICVQTEFGNDVVAGDAGDFVCVCVIRIRIVKRIATSIVENPCFVSTTSPD